MSGQIIKFPSSAAIGAYQILEATSATAEDREEAAIALAVLLRHGSAVVPASVIALGRELFKGELTWPARWMVAEVLSLRAEPANTVLALQVLHDSTASSMDVQIAARLLCGEDHLAAVERADIEALARQIGRLGLRDGVAVMMLEMMASDD